MKRVMLTIMVAAAAFSACTNETEFSTTPVGSNSEITFEAPIVAPATRGTYVVESDEKYKTTENFCVSAVWNVNDNATWVASSTYMNEVECQYNEANKTWDSKSVTGGKAYYWPKNGYLYFQAYSPASIKAYAQLGKNGLTISSYTVKNDGTQPDVMYSKRANNQTKATATDKYLESSQPGVDIQFYHALSNIKFTAKLKEDYTGTVITIKDIFFKNVKVVGTFNQYLTDNNTNSDAPVWNVLEEGGIVSYTDLVTTDYVVTTTATNPNADDLLVMPQVFYHKDATAEPVTPEIDTEITVNYTIKSPDSEPINQSFTQKVKDLTYDGTAGTSESFPGYKIGKQYTYNLIFGLDEIYFSPEVTNWEDVTVSDITN